MFLAEYSQLCANDLSGGHSLEICGGHGNLVAQMARIFPKSKVSGLDRCFTDSPAVRKDKFGLYTLVELVADIAIMSKLDLVKIRKFYRL